MRYRGSSYEIFVSCDSKTQAGDAMTDGTIDALKIALGSSPPDRIILCGETILRIHGPRVGASVIDPNEMYCVDFERRFIRTYREHFGPTVED